MAASQGVKRAAVQARSLVALPNPVRQAIFQPWTAVISEAQARYQAEIAAAMAEYQDRLKNAGTILDVASHQSAAAADKLEAAAWAAFNNLMGQAAKLREAIMGPAEQAYSDVTSQASADLQSRLGGAEAEYARVLRNVQRAMSDGQASQAAITPS